MRYGYKFKSSGVWVNAAATFGTELEAENAAKAIGLVYAVFTVFRCNCRAGGDIMVEPSIESMK